MPVVAADEQGDLSLNLECQVACSALFELAFNTLVQPCLHLPISRATPNHERPRRLSTSSEPQHAAACSHSKYKPKLGPTQDSGGDRAGRSEYRHSSWPSRVYDFLLA